MSTSSRFAFNRESVDSPDSPSIRKERPHMCIATNTKAPEKHRLVVPSQMESRSYTNKSASTPPDSPSPLHLVATVSVKVDDSGAITPPSTPTIASHEKHGSSSSDFLATITSLRRGDSISSQTSRPSLDSLSGPGSTEAICFPHHILDYRYQTNDNGKKKPIGAGVWSDVYLATPSMPETVIESTIHISLGPSATIPPITLVRSRDQINHETSLLRIPRLYAIKFPGSTSAKKVLTAEARILSYLTRFADAGQHVIPFYGQDARNGALVLKAMDGTLEDWIDMRLNSLDESSRGGRLASVFPTIALSLLDNLDFIHTKSCVHADMKPSNILFSHLPSSSPDSVPTLTISDFSSSILTLPSMTPSLSSDEVPSPLGAGTWTYLDPSLLSMLDPASPSPATDLYSLAMTLLYLIIGASPFDVFKHNQFQLREMVKSGSPLDVMAYDGENVGTGLRNITRIKTLSKALGWNVHKWMAKVLKKRVGDRVSAQEWREELVGMMKGVTGSKI